MHREQLSRLFNGYRPDDGREQSYLERMRALAEQPAAFSRHHFVPGHFTASAFVLSPERDALLLILHRKLGIWIQPGGHIEMSDADAYFAAEREINEEVGMTDLSPLLGRDALFDIDIHSIPARKSEPLHEHFDLRFAFVASSRETSVNAEVAGLRWVSLAQIEHVTSDASVNRAARKLTRIQRS